MLPSENVTYRSKRLRGGVVEGIVSEIFIGEFEKAGKVASVIHEIVSFLVIIGLAFWIGMSGREVSNPVKRALAVDRVGDFVVWSCSEGLSVRLSKGLNGAFPSNPVALRVDSIIWPFVVIREQGCGV